MGRAESKSPMPVEGIERHIDETTLERYVMGALSGGATAEVEQHLLICETCRQRVTEAEDYVRAMRSAAESAPGASESARWWGFRWLVPAVAFAALAVFALVRLGPRTSSSPAVVALTAMRGPEAAQAPANRALELHPDLRGLPPSPRYRLELVTATGSIAWKGEFQPPSALAPDQAPGDYFVRVSLPDGTLLREYALEIRR